MMHKKIMPTFADAMPSLYAGRLPTPDNICSLSNHQQCRIRILFASAMIVTSSIPMMGDAYYIMPTSRRLRARRSTAPVSFSNFEVQKSTSTPYGVHNSHYVHGIYSSDGDPMFASMIPDAHSLAHPALYSISRSTSNPEEGVGGAVFVNGREERRAKLHTELSKLGIDGNEIENHPERFGTAAIRTYNSFLLPKSAGALAVAESPTRPRVVANNFSFLVREFKADQERWLRNVDQNRSKEPKGVTSENGKHPITIILDNIRSAHNVGNILRLAEAAQIDSVRLCGMTPRPPHPKVLKTAMGAAEYVSLGDDDGEDTSSTINTVLDLRSKGIKVIGVETTENATSYWDTPIQNDDDTSSSVAYVFGNELIGVDVQVLRECDEIICLPTYGTKNSLNVATCVGIIVWDRLRYLDRVKRK